MLVFPQWRPEIHGGGCRAQRWMNAERFAPYLARPIALPPLPPQFEDDESLGGSSPEHVSEGGENKEGACEWRGCGARFPTVARLSAHVARVHAHAHRDGLFYCGWKTCSRPQRGFNARYKMLVHVRTHTNERPHTCNQCNKSFSRAENLKIHLRSHSGEKPYVCPYEGCDKAYSNSSDRFKHTRTHTVDKPYFCKVPGCNKRYTDPSSLRKHVKTYKHFTSDKENPGRDSEHDKIMERLSPQREIPTYIDRGSPLHTGIYSPPKRISSPQVYDPNVSLTETLSPSYDYLPVIDRVSYMRPLEPVYPVRVPTNEISYVEYTQMYEHAYRNYYINSINYPVLRPTITEKVYSYKEQSDYSDVRVDSDLVKDNILTEDNNMPLNLICTKRLDCAPIQELVKITDVPLDLSNKT